MTLIAAATSIVSLFVISFELYALSRVLTGYSLSLSLGLSALYLNESSPKECRGFVSMMIGVMVQLGTVVASVVAMPSLLGTTQNLWYLYLLECITLICVIVTLPFMPESPGYLGLRGDDAAARSSIMFLHGCEPSQAEVILCEIKENLKQNAKALSVSEVWRQKQTRQGTIVGIAVSLSMSFSGIAVVNAYAVEILRGCGLSLTDASLGNILLAVVSLLAIVISSFVVDRFGRRPLILVSSTVILVLNLAIFGLMYAFNRFHHTWTGYVLVVVISIFIIFFAIGPGPLCYFITAEMVDQNARAAAQSWASFTQMACRTVLLTIYLPIVHQIGQALAYLALFVVPLVLAVLFLYFNMPETKNKNYNEVLEATANLPSISKIFRSKPPATELHIPVEHSESSRTIEKF
ncbi:Solute carrier family 2, facilitated glucose transporter member 2 [Toxocara canis]|uniref:Solute carrier family 2, facilitated glucose transporter member 2 n=1 Tax=Toxocara canis TaxID=6265 RepID=A0A0B2UZA7_TOXCA|nr:Solute carrier family 2, facilitated glucose transporter member 2 [Toxocara canis]